LRAGIRGHSARRFSRDLTYHAFEHMAV
jgi:hypothetical protein